METITNLASTAATTASKLIYGDQTKADEHTTTATNETAGKEPLSGAQGKGTSTEPFDQGNAATPLASTADKATFLDYTDKIAPGEQAKGNDVNPPSTSIAPKDDDFLKLNPTLDGPTAESRAEAKTESKTESTGEPKIYTNRADETYTGMPIVPLNPDVATSGPDVSSSSKTESTGTTGATGITDKVWKETPLDDISRAGAPGAGPSAPAHVTPAVPESANSGLGSTATTTTGTDSAVKTTAPDSVTAASDTYNPTATSKVSDTPAASAAHDSKSKTENLPSTTENRDTPSWATTDVASTTDSTKPSTTAETTGLASEKPVHKSEPSKSETSKSPELGAVTSNEEKDSKMSHLKEKLKNKLHIGHKDK